MQSSNLQNNLSFLKGGGEMGNLIRNKDWSNTSLGNAVDWQQSLKTTLNIILNSRFPMFLWWGDDLICFYNDAYRPSLGQNGKHPNILGMPAQEAWAEIWTTTKPLIDQVFEGEAVWLEDQLIPIYRNGKIEDVYWTFSYSPVYNDQGMKAGILVTCTESTEKVLTVTKLEHSKAELEFAIEASNLGTFDYNPQTNKFSANQKLKEWFGLPADEQIDIEQALSAVHINDRKRVTDAIEKSLDFSTGGSYEIEYTIIQPITKKEIIIKAKGKAGFNKDKIACRLNGTVEDVTQQKDAERKLKDAYRQTDESEKRLMAMIEQAPVAITVLRGKNHVIEIANASAVKMWGRSENEVVNKSLMETLPELESYRIKEILDDVFSSQERFCAMDFPIQLLRNGSLDKVYVNFSCDPLYDLDGNVNGIMCVCYEVTEQAVARRQLQENEERLNIVIDASGLATWELNLNTKEVVYSEKYIEMMGYPKNTKLEHQQILKHIHPDDLSIRDKAMKQAFKTGQLSYELRIIWNDGSVHWLDARGKIFYDKDNKPEKTMGAIRDITYLKKHEQELMESEQKFRLLADSIPHQVWTTDNEGKLNYVNQTVYNYSGMSFDEMLIDGLLPIVHADEREKNIEVWTNAVSTGNVYEFEHRLKKAGEDYRWHSCRAVPKKDANGKIQMWVGTSIDIQEQKMFTSELEKQVQQRTRELEEHNNFIETLLNSSVDLIFVIDREFRIISANENAKKALPDENFAGKPVTDFIPNIQQLPVWSYVEEAFAGKTISYPIYKSNALNKYFEIVYVPLKRDDEVYAVMAIIHDITQRILQEEKLEQLNQTFSLAEETSKIGSFRVKLSTHTVNYSDNLYCLLGCKPQEFEAGAENFLPFVHPDDIEMVKESNSSYIANEEMKTLEFRLIKRNGEIINVRSTGVLIKENEEKYFIGTIQDITKEVQQQNILKTQNEHLEEINKELQSFAYISSHDLQEPLRKIQTFSNRIVEMEFKNLSDTGKDYFDRMTKAAKRMQVLIDDLLAYSRTNNAEKKFVKSNLKDIVEDVKEELKEDLQQKNATIDIGKLPTIAIIPFQFRQLVYNLVSNSLKFVQANVTPIIKISSEMVKGSSVNNSRLNKDYSYCHIVVADNGIGFEPEYNEKIFELFQRLHGKSEYTGTGIGLAIVKKIIANHNGLITAKGELGKGASFDIYLPVTATDSN